MTVTVTAAATAFAPVGNVDTTTAGTGSTVPMPTGLAVGDRVAVPAWYAQATGTGGQGTPPSGWAIVNPAQGTAANRMLLVYEYKIDTTAKLAALGSSVLFRSGATATRVAARAVKISGSDLTKPLVVGALEFSAAGATTITFSAPASGDKILGFVGTNSSAPTPNAIMTSVGGTKLSQDQALAAASGSVADSQLGIFDGGTGVTLSASVPNHVSWTIGIPAYVPPPSGLAGTYRDAAGVNHSGTLFYFDGSTRHDVAFDKPIYKPVTVSEVLAPRALPWRAAHRGSSYSYTEEAMFAYRASAAAGVKILEVSCWQALSPGNDGSGNRIPGQFIASHDQNLSRVSGTSLDIPTNTPAAATALKIRGSIVTGNPTQPDQPVALLTDILDAFSETHVIMVECKQGSPAKQDMINLLKTYTSTARPYTERFIWKADALGNKTAFFDPAIAAGLHRWAYIFDADMAAQFAALVASGKADIIGLDYNSSDATLAAAVAACRAAGISPTMHIVPSTAQRDRAIALGMDGIMISNVLAQYAL